MHVKSHSNLWLLTPNLLTLGLVELIAAGLDARARLAGEAVVVAQGGADWWAITPASPAAELLAFLPESSGRYTYRVTALSDTASPLFPRQLAASLSAGLLDPQNATYWTPRRGATRLRPTARRGGRSHAGPEPAAQAHPKPGHVA